MTLPNGPTGASRTRGTRRPTVAVLTTDWTSATEERWITRQVAGALACVGDVHVITIEGQRAGVSSDGVFTVHRLATQPKRKAALRSELLLRALGSSSSSRATAPAISSLIDRDLIKPWLSAAGVLGDIAPDLVVIAGHRTAGALAALDRSGVDVPIVLIALGSDPGTVNLSHFDPLFARAQSVLTVTRAETSTILEQHGSTTTVHDGKMHLIGAPLAANPSALNEPNTWVGDTDYLLVLADVNEHGGGDPAELAHLLRIRFPDQVVGIAYSSGFCAWHEGRASRGWAIERSSDVDRLMAWAHVTIDLRPGRLFAQRCVTSLLYGTPIVVPADSRAHEHAEHGRGGLWFTNPAELTWCVEAILDHRTRETFGAQGQAYAAEEFGSTDRFIDRVVAACGLVPESAPGPSGPTAADTDAVAH